MAAAVPLFLAGVYVAWTVIPNVVRALLQFTPQNGANNIDASEYLTFATAWLLFLGSLSWYRWCWWASTWPGILNGRTILKSLAHHGLPRLCSRPLRLPVRTPVNVLLAAPMLVLFFAAIGLCLLERQTS